MWEEKIYPSAQVGEVLQKVQQQIGKKKKNQSKNVPTQQQILKHMKRVCSYLTCIL